MRLLHTKWTHAAIALAVVVTVAVLLCGGPEDIGDDEADAPEQTDDSLRAQSVEIWRFGPDGRRQWELRADSISVGEQAVYRGISDGRLYSEDGFVTFEADEVVHNESTGNLTIRGNVVVTDDKGHSLETDTVLWDGGQSTMTCPGPVALASGEAVMRGGSMVGNLSTGDLQMREGVEAVFKSGKALVAEAVMYNMNDGSVRFTVFRVDDPQ